MMDTNTVKKNFKILSNRLNANIKLIKTNKRKTISIVLKSDGIYIKAPHSVDEKYIFNLLRNKEAWLIKKLKETNNCYPIEKKKFIDNEVFFFHGLALKLKIYKSNENKVFLIKKDLHLVCYYENIKAVKKNLENWYKNECCKYLRKRTDFISKKLKINYKNLLIKNYKRKLGSCSFHGNITFNWRIIMFPRPIVDYIIIHELCHRVHFNHSKKFWLKVEEYCQNFKEHKSWLKKNINIIYW